MRSHRLSDAGSESSTTDSVAPGKRARTEAIVQRKPGSFMEMITGSSNPSPLPTGLSFMDMIVGSNADSLLDHSIRLLEERAFELLGNGLPGPRELVPRDRAVDLAAAADMVSDQLAQGAGDILGATRAALHHAISRMAEVIRTLGPETAELLAPARQRLVGAAARRGVDLHAPLATPGDSRPLTGEADDVRLLDSVGERLGVMVRGAAADAPSPHFAEMVLEPAIALLRQAEGIIRGADTDDTSRFRDAVLRIQDHLDLISRRVRGLSVPELEGPLDELFQIERRLASVVGAR